MKKHYDLKILQVLATDDVEFIPRMVSLFLKQTPELMHQLRMAANSNDLSAISKLAHKLKSGIDTFCIQEIAEDIRKLERATERNWSPVETEQHIEILLKVLSDVLEELRLDFNS